MHEVVNDTGEGREPATAVDCRHGPGPKAQKAAGREAGVDGVLDVRLAAVALDDALSAGKPEWKTRIINIFWMNIWKSNNTKSVTSVFGATIKSRMKFPW